MYVRSTQSVGIGELAPHIRDALTAHAESQQIELKDVPVWITRSENPLASSGLGTLLRRRANSADPDAAPSAVLVLHASQILVVIDGAKHGTTALSLPLTQASVAPGCARARATGRTDSTSDGYSITGVPGDHGRPGSLYISMGPEPTSAWDLNPPQLIAFRRYGRQTAPRGTPADRSRQALIAQLSRGSHHTSGACPIFRNRRTRRGATR
jgi:hypothetical protein